MKLYSYWRSSSAYRVRIVLGIKALPFDYVPVNILPTVAEQRTEAFAAINPMRQVPTLEWNGVRLTQSVAIIELLEELHPEPPLLPKQPLLRARVREMVEVVNAGIQPLQNSATLAELRRLGGDDVAWARQVIAKGLTALETYARPGRYLVGDALTLADVFLVPQLYNARRHGVDLSAYKQLLAAEAAALALPAFQRAHPDAQPDVEVT